MEHEGDPYGIFADETAPLNRARIALCCLSAAVSMAAISWLAGLWPN